MILIYISDEDEFETYPEPPHSANSMKRCRVIYEYVANQQDELTIKPGKNCSIYKYEHLF